MGRAACAVAVRCGCDLWPVGCGPCGCGLRAASCGLQAVGMPPTDDTYISYHLRGMFRIIVIILIISCHVFMKQFSL